MVYRQHGFLDESPDDSVRSTRESEDEKRWKRQQAEKNRAKSRAKRLAERRGLTMVIVPSNRCEACRHWVKPRDIQADPFGICLNLGVLTERISHTPYERGHVLSMDRINALRLAHLGKEIEYEPLRCQSFATCRLFARGAYDPDADPTDEERDRAWEELRRCAS